MRTKLNIRQKMRMRRTGVRGMLLQSSTLALTGDPVDGASFSLYSGETLVKLRVISDGVYTPDDTMLPLSLPQRMFSLGKSICIRFGLQMSI